MYVRKYLHQLIIGKESVAGHGRPREGRDTEITV